MKRPRIASWPGEATVASGAEPRGAALLCLRNPVPWGHARFPFGCNPVAAGGDRGSERTRIAIPAFFAVFLARAAEDRVARISNRIMSRKTDRLAAHYLARRRRVLGDARRANEKIDALLVTDPFDVRYLSGILEGGRYLLCTRNWAGIITKPMFRVCAAEQAPGCEILPNTDRDPPFLKKLIRSHRIRGIAWQNDRMPVARFEELAEDISPRKLHGIPAMTHRRRSVKDAGEIALTRKCVRIAEAAFRELTGKGADYFIGRTERELAAELEFLMRRLGADRQAFQANNLILASGPNSYACHHRPTDRKVEDGDPVLIDWGAELDGYRSDLTRVVFLRKVRPEIAEIYTIVREAHDACIAAIKPGIRSTTLQEMAESVIDVGGHLDKFRHGLGHGLGLEIHEPPFLGAQPPATLRKGMVMTIEPGIYLEGIGGVRIESDILVTAKGHSNLGSLPTDLESMVLR